jgi:hypothetical protein
MAGRGTKRDPVSELFDGQARRLLSRAYAAPGTWVQMWLPDPGIRTRSHFAALGIGDLTGPDPLPKGGGLDAKTRWARGFVRAVYFQHKWYSGGRGGEWRKDRGTSPRNSGGLRIEVGRHVVASPQFDPAHPRAGGLPPRRRVRLQLAAGGKAKRAAVNRLADGDRWAVGPEGSRTAGPRWSGTGSGFRDWA